MNNVYEDFQKFGKDNVDVAMKSADAMSKGFKAIASEAADYSKQSFEAGSAAIEKMMSAGSFDKALEVQTEYMRSAYEGYVGQAAKVSEIFTDMAKDAYKPHEAMFGKFGK